MIKSYVYVNGSVVTKGEDEIEAVVPYYDNIGTRLSVQNEIEFLSTSLKKDEKSYNNKISQRKSSWKLYKAMAPITGAISIATPIVLSGITLIGTSASYVSTYLGDLDPYTGTVVTLLPVTITLGQTLAALELVFRPSKKEIAGIGEMVRYEKDTLNQKQIELTNLEKDIRKINSQNYNGYRIMQVDDSQIKRHKDNFKLRYAFGAYKKEICEMYEKGILYEEMKKHKFCEEAMADYMIFLEQELSKIVGNDSLSKKKLPFRKKLKDNN